MHGFEFSYFLIDISNIFLILYREKNVTTPLKLSHLLSRCFQFQFLLLCSWCSCIIFLKKSQENAQISALWCLAWFSLYISMKFYMERDLIPIYLSNHNLFRGMQ